MSADCKRTAIKENDRHEVKAALNMAVKGNGSFDNVHELPVRKAISKQRASTSAKPDLRLVW